MVQVIQGFAPQIGENIASIVDAFQNAIDPDYQVRKLIRQKAMSDPNYAQSLANFAYTNPDVYKKLGLGKIGDVIGSISPDLKTVMQEAQKGYVQEAAKNPNKELATSAGQTALYGKDEATLRKEKNDEILAGVNIATARQRIKLNEQSIKENETKLKDLDLYEQGVNKALANYPELQQLDLGKVADSFLKGEADASLMTQIESVPQLKTAFTQMVQAKLQRRQLEFGLMEAQYRRGAERRTIAQDMFVRTRAGTPALWDKYMNDPATQKRLFDLTADPKIAATPEDQQLLNMYNAISEKQIGKNSSLVKTLIPAANRLILQSKTKDADLQSIVNQLNVIYQQLGEATGDYYQANVTTEKTKNTSHWWQPNNSKDQARLKIIDLRSMEEVQPSQATVSASGAPAPGYPPQDFVGHQPYGQGKENIDLSKDSTENKTTSKQDNDRVGKAVEFFKRQKASKEEVTATLNAPANASLTQKQKDEILQQLGFSNTTQTKNTPTPTKTDSTSKKTFRDSIGEALFGKPRKNP